MILLCINETSDCGRDNEKPPRKVVVPSFQAKARPITNEEVGCSLVMKYTCSPGTVRSLSLSDS